jgi:hypothetical protein
MTLPLLGGMSVEFVTLFVVPVLYAFGEEIRLRRRQRGSSTDPRPTAPSGSLQ